MSRPIRLSILAAGCLVMLALLSSSWGSLAQAAPLAQTTPLPTPTPGPDGRILYIVQEGDSWWRIAAIYNLDLNQLYTLNNATSDTVLVPGREVLLGMGGPSGNPTQGANPTPMPTEPLGTSIPGSGTLCVLVFEDKNGDSIRQETELSIPRSEISVTDRSGEVSLTGTTLPGSDPFCFKDLPEDDYNVSVAVPDGYNPTTVLNYGLKVEPGAETFLDFGAQMNSVALAEAPTPTGSGRSPLLGIFGGLLLVGGLVLGLLASRLVKRRGPPVEPTR